MPLDLKQPTLRHHVILLIIIGGMSEIRTHNLSGDKHWLHRTNSGADPGFQVRGGVFKKNRAERREARKFWGISCEKSRFYDKKIIFFPIAEGGANIFGVFRVKNHDFTPTKSFFPILGGACAGCAAPPPPWNRPCNSTTIRIRSRPQQTSSAPRHSLQSYGNNSLLYYTCRHSHLSFY